MIGAREHDAGEALCLVSVGTPLTLDLLRQRRHHGAIVPARR
jgi:pantothenate kinase type III